MKPPADEKVLAQPLGICKSCRKIPFHTLHPQPLTGAYRDPVPLHNEFDTYSHFRLGTLRDVELKSHRCTFCFLINEIAHFHCPQRDFSHTVSTVFTYLVGRVKKFDEFSVWTDNHASQRLQLSRATLTFRTGSKTKRISPRENDASMSFELHLGRLGTDERHLDGRHHSSCSARSRPSRCDFSLIRSWLKECTEIHGRDCEKPRLLQSMSGRSRSSFRLRLVNVERRCLEEFDGTLNHGHPKYVALSYVWGTPTQVLGLHQGDDDVYRDGGVSQPSQTIKDAMAIVQELKYTYLWVDVLCVVQDSNEEKLSDISHMCDIYTQADLTIIAASSGTANDGISGISFDRPRQFSINMPDNTSMLTAASEPLILSQGPALDNKWSTRAWTLQEQVLSKRCLFFLNDQVFWRCVSGDRFEDIEMERHSWEDQHLRVHWHRVWPARPKYSMLQPRKTNLMKIFHIEQDVNMERELEFQENFKALAEAYAKRDLTLDTDIEYAFQGIMTGLANDFHKGVPARRFEEYLCWHASNGKDQHLRPRKTCGIPTWSWMAWQGQLSYQHIHSGTQPAVVCYKMVTRDDEQGAQTRMLEPVTQRRFSVSSPGAPSPPGIYWHETNNSDTEWQRLRDGHQAPILEDVDCPTLTSDHLVFYAELLKLKVNCLRSQREKRDKDDTYLTTYTVIDTDERFLTSFQEIQSGLDQQPGELSFFAVANTTTQVCVMRVGWHQGIARRHGMHIIARNRWDLIRKTRKLIVLG